MKKQAFIIIGILLVVTAFLRLYQIGPFMTFLGDQGRDAIIVKRIITFEHFPAIGAPSSVGQIFLGPFYYYLIAPFLLLFNFNPIGLGVGVAVLSIVAMIYISYEMNKEFGAFFTTIFVAFMTFSFTLIDLSRFSWNPNLLPYFSFITLFFFYKWVKEKKWLYALLFGLFLGCSFQLHYLSIFIFGPIAGYFLYSYIQEKKKIIFLKQTVFAVIGFVFISVPLILFDIKNNFLNVKGFMGLFSSDQVSSENSYISKLEATSNAFVNHVFQIEPTTFITATILVLFAGASFLVAKKQKNLFITWNIILVIAYIFQFAFLSSHRYIHYFTPIYVSFYFVLSFIVLLIPKRKFQFIVVGVFVSVFVWLQIPKYYFFTANPANQIDRAKKIAESFHGHIQKQPIQLVALPFTETEGHFRYFLEIQGVKLLPLESFEQADELYVICFDLTNCRPLDDPHWQIAAFYDKMLAESWQSEGATIYKIVHKQK